MGCATVRECRPTRWEGNELSALALGRPTDWNVPTLDDERDTRRRCAYVENEAQQSAAGVRTAVRLSVPG